MSRAAERPPPRPPTHRPGPLDLGSRVAPFVVATIGAAVVVAVLLAEWRALGAPSFPLDDAWIHLVYARNVQRHLAWTYFPGTPPSAGSTSPAFTLLEAIGLGAGLGGTAVALGIGLLAHAAFLLTFAAFARRRLGGAWATLAVALVAFDGRLIALAVSGMETSLFLLLGTLALLAHDAGRFRWRGLALGLGVWTRPDALIPAGAIAMDGWLARRASPEPDPARRAWLGWAAFAGLVVAWAGWNLVTGGSPMPATFAAKLAFYGGTSRAAFLLGDVARTFASGGWALLLPFAAAAVAHEANVWRARRPSPARAALATAIALPLAYALLLPFSHRFDRYLVPALPPLAVASLAMARAACARWPRAGALAMPFAAAALGLHGLAFANTGSLVTEFARHHLEVHARAGRWIAANTPADAIVATHDVGAVAWFGERRVVDVVGLVTPGMATHLRRSDYRAWLRGELDRRDVTHVAALDEWLPVEGVEPLFTAGSGPDAMRVTAWGPTAHLVEPAIRAQQDAALDAMRRGVPLEALARLERARAADPRSPRTWTLIGLCTGRAGDPARAIEAFTRALQLAPGSTEARMGLALSLAASGRRTEARALADTLAATTDGLPGLVAFRDSLAGD